MSSYKISKSQNAQIGKPVKVYCCDCFFLETRTEGGRGFKPYCRYTVESPDHFSPRSSFLLSMEDSNKNNACPYYVPSIYKRLSSWFKNLMKKEK